MDSGSTPEVGPEDRGPVPERPPSGNASGRQLFWNVANSYASYAVTLVLSLILTRVLLRHLGAGAYGLWAVLLALVGYLSLLDVGVSTAAVQRVARLMAEHDHDGVADVIRTTWIFFGVTAVLAILVTVGLAPFVASFLNLGGISPTLAGTTLIVLGVMSALLFLSSVPRSVLFGSGRNDRLSQIGLVSLLLTQGGQILAVLSGAGLVALALLQAAGVGLVLVITASVVRRITGSSIRHGRFSRPLLGDLLRFGGAQSVVGLSDVVAFQVDALIIGIILPVAQVAPYNVALNTSNLTRTLSTQGTNLLIPTYAHHEVFADRRRQATYFCRSVMACLAIAVPVVVALAAYGDPILEFWLGSVPPKTYEIVVTLGIVTAMQLPGHQCFLFLTGVGRNRLLVRWALTGAVVSLVGSIGATYWLGPVGPAVGSLPVVVVISSLILPAMVCRHVGVPFSFYAKRALLPIVPVAAVAGATALVLVNLVPSPGGGGAILGAVVIVAASLVALAVVVVRIEPDLRDALVRRYRSFRGTRGDE